ncbi:unnamed protein product [Symbiodinium sp. KB8]|nr:unnamed protein product [Symbiodinium sp. KB8]
MSTQRNTGTESAVEALRSVLSSGGVTVNGQVVQDEEGLYYAIDSDGRGMLEREQILTSLMQLGLGLDDELTQFVSSMEVNADQCVEVAAFVRAMNPATRRAASLLFQHPRKDELRAVVVAVNDKLKQGITISGSKVRDVNGFFKALDTDSTRSLTKAEISKGFKRLKISISEKLLEDLVNASDVDRSRRIEMKEFVRLLDPASWTDPDGGAEEERAQSEKVLKEVTGKIKFTLKAGGRTLYGKRVTDARTFYEAVDSGSAGDGSGALEKDELFQGLQRLGVTVPEYQIVVLINALDGNKSGLIELPELVLLFEPTADPEQLKEEEAQRLSRLQAERQASLPSEDEIQAQIADVVAQITVQMHTEQTLFGQTIQDAKSFFNALDHDRTGALDRGELKQGLKRLGIAMPSYLLDALLVKMDTNQNGLIEMKEVQRTFRPEPLDESKVKELRRRSIELGLTLREANAVSPEELQELLEGEDIDIASPASDAIAAAAAQLKRELLEKERLLEEARKEIQREKAQRAAEAAERQAAKVAEEAKAKDAMAEERKAEALERAAMWREEQALLREKRLQERKELEERTRMEAEEMHMRRVVLEKEKRLREKEQLAKRIEEMEERQREKYASRIQALWRAKKVQRAIEAKKKLAFEQRRQGRVVRQLERVQARKRVEELEKRKKEGAAVLIQKLQRGRLARRNYDKERRVVEMRKQKEEFVKRIEWAEDIKRKQAAIKIQRMRRSQMARRSVLEEIRRLRQEKLERKRQLAMDKAKERIAIEQRIKEMAERRKAKAVTSIAKVWRGYKVRVETARIKQARATAARLREQQRLEAKALRKREERIEQRRRAEAERRRQEDLAKSIARDLERKWQDKAARKIQAARRGQLERRQQLRLRELEKKRKVAERNEKDRAQRAALAAQQKEQKAKQYIREREILRNKWEDLEEKRRQQIMEKIQAVVRGFMTRRKEKKEKQRRREERDAAKRGRELRRKEEEDARKREQLLKDLAWINKKLKEMEEKRRYRAAVRIQAYIRGTLCRFSFRKELKEKRANEEAERKRKKAMLEEAKRQRVQREEAERKEALRKEIAATKKKLDEMKIKRRKVAATKVQAVRRGQLARREYRRYKEAKRKEEEEKQREDRWRKDREKQKKEEDAYFERVREQEKIRQQRKREVEHARKRYERFQEYQLTRAALMIQAARRLQLARRRVFEEMKKIRDKLEAERQERRRQKAIEKAKIERRLKAMEEKRRNDAALVIQARRRHQVQKRALILDKQQRAMVKRNLRGAAMRELFAEGDAPAAAATAAGPPQRPPGQCPAGVAGAAAGAPFGAAPCQLPLPTGQVRQAGPQMATTFPLAQSYSPAQADGSVLSEFGESYFPEFGRSPEHTSQPSQPPVACAFGGQAQAVPAMTGNVPGTPTSFPQSTGIPGMPGMPGVPGMPMPEQTPPGYRSGAVSQADPRSAQMSLQRPGQCHLLTCCC